MLRTSIGMMYEAVTVLGRDIIFSDVSLINKLLHEASIDCTYSYNLFAVVLLILPTEIDFKTLFELGGKVKKL